VALHRRPTDVAIVVCSISEALAPFADAAIHLAQATQVVVRVVGFISFEVMIYC